MAPRKILFSALRTCGLIVAVGLIGTGCVSNSSPAGRSPSVSQAANSRTTAPLPSAASNPFVGGGTGSDRSNRAASNASESLTYYAARIPSSDQDLRHEARIMLAAFTNAFYAAGSPIKDAPLALRDGFTPIATRFDSSGSRASIAILIDRNPPSSASFQETIKRRLKQICQGRITFDVDDISSGLVDDAKAIWSSCSTGRGPDIVTSTAVIARPPYGFWVITVSDPSKILDSNRSAPAPSSSGSSGHADSMSNPFR